ncbi:MAG TPA: alpha/beta hydrolase [Acidimicrobiia bacterium]|nr:alpha/beta hydrolase [Acidimicrobiia bacterium]
MRTTGTNSTEPTGFARFRSSEQAVWDHYRLRPSEALVPIRSGGVIRVHEIGSGSPILFVHGSGGSGVYWAPLVTELVSQFRCILMDRPGWTLSTPMDYSIGSFGTIAASMQADLLDAIGVDRVHVVGGSIGNMFALRFAQAHPDRVGGVVLAGGGPLTDAVEPPTFIKLLRSPLGRIIIRIPQKPGMVRKQMQGLGHKTSLDQGLIPDELIELYTSTSRYTEAMRHERDLVRSILDRDGFVNGFTVSPQELKGITVPALIVYGLDDPVGTVDIWKRFAESLENGSIYTLADSGHLNWYDKPHEAGARIAGHLANIHLYRT